MLIELIIGVLLLPFVWLASLLAIVFLFEKYCNDTTIAILVFAAFTPISWALAIPRIIFIYAKKILEKIKSWKRKK